MRTGRNRISLCRQQIDGSLVQKAFQNRTTIGGKLDMDILDKGIAPWPALMDLKLHWIDQFLCPARRQVIHLSLRKPPHHSFGMTCPAAYVDIP